MKITLVAVLEMEIEPLPIGAAFHVSLLKSTMEAYIRHMLVGDLTVTAISESEGSDHGRKMV
jgi:hypothetical protein